MSDESLWKMKQVFRSAASAETKDTFAWISFISQPWGRGREGLTGGRVPLSARGLTHSAGA